MKTFSSSNELVYYIVKQNPYTVFRGKLVLVFLDKVPALPGHRVTNVRCGPVAAPSVTSLSESLPVQCTDGSVPEAQSALDSTASSMQPR